MKALPVIAFALVIGGTAATAATALTYSHAAIRASFAAVGSPESVGTTEPAFMVLSGGALLGLAGALKRLTF